MTGEKYNEFSVDLFKLWYAGNTYSPVVADAYADTAAILNASAHSDSGISGDFAESNSEIYTQFNKLRSEVIIMFGRISERLYGVGEVLVQAADSFAAQDDDTAVELDYQNQKDRADITQGPTHRPDRLDTAPEISGSDDILPDNRPPE